jgi:para-aminobenzoate synthetase component 1
VNSPDSQYRAQRATALAHFAGRLATELRDVTDDPAALDSSGYWAVVGTYEGEWTFARFANVRTAPLPVASWRGPPRVAWTSSMDGAAYTKAVQAIRDEIAAGEVYQVNLCRVLSAPVHPAAEPLGLAGRLAAGNPAPFAGIVDLPARGVRVVTASPELYLRRAGRLVTSEPIKGTARVAA